MDNYTRAALLIDDNQLWAKDLREGDEREEAITAIAEALNAAELRGQ